MNVTRSFSDHVVLLYRQSCCQQAAVKRVCVQTTRGSRVCEQSTVDDDCAEKRAPRTVAMRAFFAKLGEKLKTPSGSPRQSTEVSTSTEVSPRPPLPPAAVKVPISGRACAGLALCLAFLSRRGLHVEGIYRVPGASVTVGELSTAVGDGDVRKTAEIIRAAEERADDDAVHLVACAVKRVLRVHEPLLS